MILISVYLILLLMLAALIVGVYFALARFNRKLAVAAALFAVPAAVLLFPLPIHGGFTMLGEALFHDLGQELSRRGEVKIKERKLDFINAYEERFAGEIPDPAVTAAAQSGWIDSASGLVWAGVRELPAGEDSLDAAKKACRELAPAGYWALPTEAEYYTFWKANGRDARFDFPGRFISYIVDAELGLELRTLVVSRKGHGGAGQASGDALPHRVHCVGRTAKAPRRGYQRGDIPPAEWNRFHLEKGGA